MYKDPCREMGRLWEFDASNMTLLNISLSVKTIQKKTGILVTGRITRKVYETESKDVPAPQYNKRIIIFL